MNKKYFFIIVLFLTLSFLYIILLDEDYQIALNSLMILYGVLPMLVGINNSFHYMKIGIGITRKEIVNRYILDLVFTIILGIIYLIVINLFAYLVYKEINVLHKNVISTTIFLYSFTIFLSSLIMFVYNIFFIFKKKYTSILLTILMFFVVFSLYLYLYIKMMYFIGILISVVLFIIFTYINKTLTLKKKM